MSTIRAAAIRASSIVQDTIAHAGFGHDNRTLCHTSRVTRPKHGRSTKVTFDRACTQPVRSHPKHERDNPGPSTTPSTVTATATAGQPATRTCE